MSFDIRVAVAQIAHKRGSWNEYLEAPMPAYEICYLDRDGALTYKYAATCEDDNRAKVLAHAMKLPSVKRLEVWNGESLVYARPSDSHPVREQLQRAN